VPTVGAVAGDILPLQAGARFDFEVAETFLVGTLAAEKAVLVGFHGNRELDRVGPQDASDGLSCVRARCCMPHAAERSFSPFSVVR
jgi:hypothetical protein